MLCSISATGWRLDGTYWFKSLEEVNGEKGCNRTAWVCILGVLGWGKIIQRTSLVTFGRTSHISICVSRHKKRKRKKNQSRGKCVTIIIKPGRTVKESTHGVLFNRDLLSHCGTFNTCSSQLRIYNSHTPLARKWNQLIKSINRYKSM